jgi:hypothetical protein
MRKRSKVLLGVLAAVALLLCLAYAGLCVWLGQGFSNPVLAALPVPGARGAEVWLLEGGFIDRGITLYVKSPSLNDGKPMRIVDLDWDGLYSFSRLQWSKDGQFVVFTIRLAAENEPEVNAFAYDFSTGRAALPAWQRLAMTSEKPLAEWQQHEKTLAALAAAHGGLTGAVHGPEDLRAHARKLWYWQAPK